MKYFISVLLLNLCCSAQTFQGGSVVNELPNFTYGLSFTLLGGAFSPTAKKIKIFPVDNQFSFSGTDFILVKTDNYICRGKCTFTGTFDPYTFSVIPISKECSAVIGHLNGTLTSQFITTSATANYSQVWCHLPFAEQMAGGDLSIIFNQ